MGFFRVWLAIAVILTHSNSPIKFMGGQLAVKAFFVLSGFYMQLSVDQRSRFTNWIWGFYKSRLVRIYPLYFIFLIVSIVGYFAALQFSWGPQLPMYYNFLVFDEGSWLAQGSVILTNLFLFAQDWFRFLRFDTGSGHFALEELHGTNSPNSGWQFMVMGQTWSLGMELMFYLLCPLLLTRRTITLVAAALLSFIGRIVLARHGFSTQEQASWTFAFFPSELGVFLCCGLACRFAKHIEQDFQRNLWLKVFGILLVICAVISGLGFDFLIVDYWHKYWLFFVLFTLSSPFLFLLSQRRRWDENVGELSYPIYLAHMLFVIPFTILFTPLLTGIWSVVATLVLSIAVVYWIDRPISTYLRNLGSRVRN